MKAKFIWAIAAIATIVGLTSCNESSNGDGPATFMNFMTLTANSESGSVLEMYSVANNMMLTFTSDRTFDEKSKIKVGDRLLVMYTYPSGRTPYTSGAIDIMAYRWVTNGGVTWDNINGMYMGDLQTQSVTIEGKYLNYTGAGVYYNDYKTLRLVADESTVDDKMPVVYLQYEGDAQANGTWKQLYASFDISDIWSSSKYEGFTLRINDTNSAFCDLVFKREDVIKPANWTFFPPVGTMCRLAFR